MSNFILCNLALTDMLTGLFTQPLFATLMMTSAFCVKFCLVNTITIIIGNLLSSISVASLFLITLDRHISIFYPFYYEKIKDDKIKLIAIVIIIWLGNILIVFGSLATPKMTLTSVLGSTFAIVIFFWSLYVNVKAVVVVKKIQRQIQSHVAVSARRNVEERSNSEAMSRVTRLVSTILGSMLLCYMPFVVFTFIEIHSDLPFNAWVWISTLVFLNSLANPIVYVLQMKEIRTEMKIILSRLCCCRTVAIIRQKLSTVAPPSVATTVVRPDPVAVINN